MFEKQLTKRRKPLIVQTFPFLALFLGYFSLLVFADYALIPSFTLSMYLSLVSFCGMFVFLAITRRSEFNQFELIGVGIAFGTLVPAFIGYVLRSFLGVPSVYGVFFFISIAVACMVKLSNTEPLLNTKSPLWMPAVILFGASSATAQFVNLYYLAAAEILIFVFIYLKFSNRMNRLKLSFLWILQLLAVVLTTRFSVFSEQAPIWRKILYVDQIFDTAQSWSIARFGFTDNVFAARNVMPGHTLTHSWAGITQALLNTPTFLTSGLAGIILGALGSSALIMGFAYRINQKISALFGSAFIWVYQSSFVDQFYASPNPRISNSISLFWFTFAIYILLEFRNEHLKRPLFIVPVILAVIGLGKLHWSVFIIATSGLVAATELLANPRSKQNRVFFVSAFIAGLLLILAFMMFMKDMNAHNVPTYSFVLSTFFIYAAVFLNRSLGLQRLGLSSEQLYLWKLLISGFLLFIPLISLTGGANAETYFITCALVPMTMVVGPTFFDQVRSLLSKNHKITVGLVLIVVSTFLTASITNAFYWRIVANQSQSILNFLITFFDVFILFSAICVSVCIFLVFRRDTVRRFFLITSIVLAAMNFGLFVSSQFRTQIWNSIYGEQLAELSLSQSQISVGEWIRENSNPNDIVATNHYCQQRAEVGGTPPVHPEECRQRGLNSWIGAISQRRMLIEAPLVSVYGPGAKFTPESAKLYNLPLDFADGPTVYLQNELKVLGVRWFVVAKTLTDVKSWNSTGDVVFENTDYVVLEI